MSPVHAVTTPPNRKRRTYSQPAGFLMPSSASAGFVIWNACSQRQARSYEERRGLGGLLGDLEARLGCDELLEHDEELVAKAGELLGVYRLAQQRKQLCFLLCVRVVRDLFL